MKACFWVMIFMFCVWFFVWVWTILFERVSVYFVVNWILFWPRVSGAFFMLRGRLVRDRLLTRNSMVCVVVGCGAMKGLLLIIIFECCVVMVY